MTVGGTTAGKDDWSGRLLDGRYRVERVLGSGGMGTVYLAQDEKMQRPVVVKVPHPKMLADEGFRARFDREIRSLTRLSHRSVVKVLDAGSIEAPGAAEPVPYAVLEFLAGGSLTDRMASKGGQQSVEEVLSWLPSIAEALDFIHKQGVVHRDVKPSNVLFDQEGHVYLADFGIAKALGSPDTGLTQTGATPGSPNYMAPDVMLSKAPLGPAYDQYSLAVVVYEALAGVLPHVDESPLRLIHLKASVAPRSLHEVAPQVPAPVAAVVTLALSIDASARFATCSGFAYALRTGIAEASVRRPSSDVSMPAVSVPTESVETTPTSPRRKSKATPVVPLADATASNPPASADNESRGKRLRTGRSKWALAGPALAGALVIAGLLIDSFLICKDGTSFGRTTEGVYDFDSATYQSRYSGLLHEGSNVLRGWAILASALAVIGLSWWGVAFRWIGRSLPRWHLGVSRGAASLLIGLVIFHGIFVGAMQWKYDTKLGDLRVGMSAWLLIAGALHWIGGPIGRLAKRLLVPPLATRRTGGRWTADLCLSMLVSTLVLVGLWLDSYLTFRSASGVYVESGLASIRKQLIGGEASSFDVLRSGGYGAGMFRFGLPLLGASAAMLTAATTACLFTRGLPSRWHGRVTLAVTVLLALGAYGYSVTARSVALSESRLPASVGISVWLLAAAAGGFAARLAWRRLWPHSVGVE